MAATEAHARPDLLDDPISTPGRRAGSRRTPGPIPTGVAHVAHRPPDEAVRLPAAALHSAAQRWLAGQNAIRSVALGVALADNGATPPWTGEADLGGPSVHAGDEYGVLSITKTFTEALVLREVAAGHIVLDESMPPIHGIVMDRAELDVTPRMLLQHTSGLVNYPKAVGYDPSRPISPQEIVSLALQSPRVAKPGVVASYSNTNFHWLGLLLEEVTGRSYSALIDGLAAEVGLTNTRLDPMGRPGWIGYSSGGLRSTVGDLARWGAALFTPGRVLPAAQLQALSTIGKVGVSLGLWPLCPCPADAEGTQHPAALHQTVANGGFFYFPDRKLIVVVHYELDDSQATTNGAGSLARAIYEALEDGKAG